MATMTTTATTTVTLVAEEKARMPIPHAYRDARDHATYASTPASVAQAKRQRTSAPPLDDLLVSLDVASRDEMSEVENTVEALVERAKEDGVHPRTYLALAVLIAFKRRNHKGSQAPGLGAGERSFIRVILHKITAHEPEMARLVLPLVPLYGCWRDLLMRAEATVSDSDGLSDAICECGDLGTMPPPPPPPPHLGSASSLCDETKFP